jgi:hypothetical protein
MDHQGHIILTGTGANADEKVHHFEHDVLVGIAARLAQCFAVFVEELKNPSRCPPFVLQVEQTHALEDGFASPGFRCAALWARMTHRAVLEQPLASRFFGSQGGSICRRRRLFDRPRRVDGDKRQRCDKGGRRYPAGVIGCDRAATPSDFSPRPVLV